MRREWYGLAGGITVAVILGILSWVKGNEAFFLQTAGWAGSAALILGAFISGNFLTGERVRQHQAHESRQDRKNRRTAAGILFLFSLPLLAADVVVALW